MREFISDVFIIAYKFHWPYSDILDLTDQERSMFAKMILDHEERVAQEIKKK